MVKLVASDLDGTLLRSDGSISPRTLAALGQLTAQGVIFVAVTARPLRMVLAGETRMWSMKASPAWQGGKLTVLAKTSAGDVVAQIPAR